MRLKVRRDYMQKVQPISNSWLPSNLDFDREQLFDRQTGKTICDTDSNQFSQILEEALNRENTDLRTHCTL